MLAGGLLGALGSAGIARCVNIVRGTDRSWLAWNGEALDTMVEAALLRYLAVAHFGRGRGDWAEGESPPHWKEEVVAALAPQREALKALWSSRSPKRTADDDGERLAGSLQPLVADAVRRVLESLYADASAVFGAQRPTIGESPPARPHVLR